MVGNKGGILGTKERPVDNSVEGQKRRKAHESATSQQPGAVQRIATEETAGKSDKDKQKSIADSSGRRPESRQGKTAVGKSGQGAMKAKSDPAAVQKFDSYADISPRKERGKKDAAQSAEPGATPQVTSITKKRAKPAVDTNDATDLEENSSHFESNNGNF